MQLEADSHDRTTRVALLVGTATVPPQEGKTINYKLLHSLHCAAAESLSHRILHLARPSEPPPPVVTAIFKRATSTRASHHKIGCFWGNSLRAYSATTYTCSQSANYLPARLARAAYTPQPWIAPTRDVTAQTTMSDQIIPSRSC